MDGADLRHVTTWLFDLDNTLYPLETGLGIDISERITDFVEQLTGLPRDQARTLQKRYLDEHGLTLRGLMLNHGVDPNEFHETFADLSLEALAHDPELIGAIGRLPGRRLIFTNADAGHARRVMNHLRLDMLFHEVFHIESADFIPKPDPEAFRRLIAAHALEPASTAFFEDRAMNLEPAKALGMTTVLVGLGAEANDEPFVDHRAPRLAPFLASARVKETV
ncbi:MAG TPA: pyrimidine 5'-nucleotidase [Caulobacteraceae bacterium]|nr:pyrimidine 5'-nucleotidase [Caulobacteraceae bacterium]